MTSSLMHPHPSTTPSNPNLTAADAYFEQAHPDYLSLVQISDLHLYADPQQLYNGINPANNFEQIRRIIVEDFAASDGLMVTGDILQQPNFDDYTQFFQQLDTLNTPYVCIAGNHDVTLELDGHLPFTERRHEPVCADNRLVNCYKISSPFWDILCIDSSVIGKVHGHFSEETLRWVTKTLAESDKFCVIFSHHPMALVGSAWIDQHTLDNSDAFWSVVKPFGNKLKGVFVGHVHQELQLIQHGFSLFTCPAVSVQFKSFCEDYTLDTLTAGLRWLTLYNNGTLATGIKRIDTI